MSGAFDPRDVDSRERDDGIHDREDQYVSLGRGGGGLIKDADDEGRGRDTESRQRDREARDQHDDRGLDPRDVLVRDLDLPHGHHRELVHGGDRDYTLNGSDTRTLATVGAFRVVSERDLRDPRGSAGDLRHLEDQGLIQRVPLNEQERGVTLTQDGRGLLERHREPGSERHQTFYAGADRARERSHDTQVYRAYLKAAERLQTREARILRVELDRDLKREHQRFLQERTQLRSLSVAYGAPRFRALFRAWQQLGDPVVWAAQSYDLRDALQRGEGRVEFVKLTHQYCHLSSLVGVA